MSESVSEIITSSGLWLSTSTISSELGEDMTSNGCGACGRTVDSALKAIPVSCGALVLSLLLLGLRLLQHLR